MGQDVVTTLTIDADTSGVDKFSQAMASAEQAANGGVSSALGFNTSLLAIGGGAAAAVLGIKSMLDYVADANKGLADMATVAHQVGLTLTDFQGIRFGGAIKGLSTDQINTGLEKSAQLLNDASRNSNSLSKELDANGISVKNANGQLISENQLLGIAANLVKNAANPGDAAAIAQMLGFTKEWIPLLEQGAGAMSGLAAEARAAGAVIDDETIKKASEFDTQWRKSSVEWSAYMKAAIAGMPPEINDVINKAVEFIQRVKNKGGGIDGLVKAGADAILNSAGVDPNQVHTLEVTPEAQASWSVFLGKLSAAKEYLSSLVTLQDELSQPPDTSTPLLRITSATPFSASQDPMNSGGYPKSGPKDFDALQRAIDKAAADAAAAGGSHSIVASKDTQNDAVDRAINTLRRHTEAQIADAKAVGLGDGALAGFRAQAAETAAVQANGGKETAAQAAEFAKLRDAASAAADGLARAKVASQIDFGRKTAFLSADDVAIANQLKGIYGNDIPRAMASTEAEALRTNNAMKGLSTAIETNLTSGLTDIVTGTKSVSQGFKDMGLAIIKAIDEMIIKMLIVQPLMRSLQGVGASLGIPGVTANAHGNMFSGGNVIPFARGGVVDSPTIAPMALFGESGPEAIVPLRRGSDGNLGIASKGGGGDTHITYQIDASGADSGTVQRIQSVLAAHAKAITGQGKAMQSAQRYQATGVS